MPTHPTHMHTAPSTKAHASLQTHAPWGYVLNIYGVLPHLHLFPWSLARVEQPEIQAGETEWSLALRYHLRRRLRGQHWRPYYSLPAALSSAWARSELPLFSSHRASIKARSLQEAVGSSSRRSGGGNTAAVRIGPTNNKASDHKAGKILRYIIKIHLSTVGTD